MLPLSVNIAQTYNLMSLNDVLNETNEVLDDGDILTIGIGGTYLIRSQHTITTSQAKLNPETYTSVNISCTWTVCNLTSPNSNDVGIPLVSETLFAKLDVAEFYILYILIREKENLVGVCSELRNAPANIRLHFQVRYTSELIDSNSMEHAVIDSSSTTYKHERRQASAEMVQQIDYSGLVKSMRQQCAIFKYYVEYELL